MGDLEGRLAKGLAAVEEHLHRVITSDEPFITEAAAHLLNAGGKRFRPMLVIVCAEYGDPDHPHVVPAGCAVELTHLATLYHDDVMDEATMRRGAETANRRWDNSLAILVGDFLFAHASEVTSTLGPDAVGVQARTFARLVKGQVRETIGPHEGEDPLEHYLSVVADKTGSLIATSAYYGAHLSGASPEVVATVTEFGERIGSAFQLSDDVIDISSDSDDSGKTPGTDLREGVPTLPTLLARRSSDPADADLVRALSAPITDDDEVAQVLAALRVHPAMDEARAFVQSEADSARALLDRLPAGEATDALHEVCDRLASRDS
ncbi:MAG TPA: polyprenyl synthetase family protein [Aeromicrobium sp.]|nr:polyprenyl synthetase family protein [Aeromicrobium sp.]